MKAVVAAAIVIAAATVAGVVIHDARDPSSGMNRSPQAMSAMRHVQRASEEAARRRATLVGSTAVLRRRSMAGDRIPLEVIDSPVLRGVPMDWSTTRRLSVLVPRWVGFTADDGQVCVVATSALSCSDIDTVVERGVAPSVSWQAGAGVTIDGVASDAVKRVAIHFRDRTVRAPVRHNYFFARSSVVPDAIAWMGPRGKESTVMPVGVRRQRPATVAPTPDGKR